MLRTEPMMMSSIGMAMDHTVRWTQVGDGLVSTIEKKTMVQTKNEPTMKT